MDFYRALRYNKCRCKLTIRQKTLHFGGSKLRYIPEKRKNRQITLFDFNQSCGMELNPNNGWIKLAHAIPWSRMETKYVAMFPSKTGRPATPFRMALGVLIIQKRKKLSDRAVIKEIQENPCLQYFLGMEKFSHEAL